MHILVVAFHGILLIAFHSFRNVPIHIAERVVAVVLFLSNGCVKPQMFAMKPANDPKRKATTDEKEQLVRERIANASNHLSTLRRRFKCRHDMIPSCGLMFEDCRVWALSATDRGILDATCDRCILCFGNKLPLGNCASDKKDRHPILAMEPCPLCMETCVEASDDVMSPL